jgi:F-type H+-transporting ATPase subunit gamma
MANLKDIRKRINSVKNTQKITKAMKMVAAAKLRRAQEAIMNTRPYARRIDGLIKGLTEVLDGYMHPMMTPHERMERVGLLVLTSDRGMAGPFNTNILRRTTLALAEDFAGKDVSLYLVGRKANDYLKRRPVKIEAYFNEVFHKDHSLFEEADAISDRLTRDFLDDKLDQVWVVYNEFKSAISQTVILEKLVPIQPDEDAEPTLHDYVYEPGRKAILDKLAPQHLSIQLYRCLQESLASEQGARMSAMEGATRSAGEMIDKLTLKYNRARQAAITKELMEIIGGAEALK